MSHSIDLQTNERNFNYKLIPAYNFEVNTKPSGAQIFMDGVSKGYSPVNFSASKGAHKLSIEKKGLVKRKTNVIATDKPQKRTYSLKESNMIGLGYQTGSAGTNGGAEVFIANGKVFISFSFSSIYSLSYDYANVEDPIGLTFQLGYRNPYPFEFVLHGGLGIRNFGLDSTGEVAYNHLSPVVGICKPIHFTPSFGLYFNVDYWPITEGSEGIFLYSAGLFF